MATQGNPTVRRRIFASELRRLRAAASLTQQQAEEAIGLGRASLSRYESCTSSPSVPVAKALLELFGVERTKLDALLDLVKGARARGWLKGFKGVVPTWFEDLVALERDASTIQELALHAIPGIMQTERYARAVLQAGILGLDVEGVVKARLARAEILRQEKPPEYWVVLCESALDCVVGGPDVMREQLEHLAELAQHPHITIQVLPNSHGAHPSMTSPFIMLDFEIAPDFGVVYLDYLTGSLYRDEPHEVERYRRAYRHLIKSALPEGQSLQLITARAKEP